jgi:hypothetical protein
MTEQSSGGFTTATVEALTKRAIDPAFAAEHGVVPVHTEADLPEGCPDYWRVDNGYLPGALFPWRSPTNGVVWQLRPDVPVAKLDEDGTPGRARKYVFGDDAPSVLNALKVDPDDAVVLIVEGTCQSLAAARYAPDGVSVYGIPGCHGWVKTGIPTEDLYVVEGKQVVLAFDADAGSNLAVYSAAEGLARACMAEGAAGVKGKTKAESIPAVRFLQVPGTGKSGLDDVLAKTAEDRREAKLGRLIEQAIDKPAPTKPTKADQKKAEATDRRQEINEDGRPVVIVNDDRFKVITELTDVLTDKWSGTRLFNFGDAVCEFTDSTAVRSKARGALAPLEEDGRFQRLVQESAVTVTRKISKDGEELLDYAWPDGQTMRAVGGYSEKYAPVDRVLHAPFVRSDGTICSTSGYDEASRTILVLAPELEGLEIPENPTREDVEAAIELLMGHWLFDTLAKMPDRGSRANTLALLLTPFVRAMTDLVPLAVIDGLQKGVGKGMLLELLVGLWLGEAMEPLPYSKDDDEVRKVILSAFRAGNSIFAFDEAHVITGANLTRATTARHYTDRVLGGSVMASFPNLVTWVSMGNQVRVEDDMDRRVYRIRIAPDEANPQDRAEDTYKIPNILEWTRENRPALLKAVLTIIRYWHVAGRPTVPADMASYMQWQKIVGGILATAGVPGFLEGRTEWRQESNFGEMHWTQHLAFVKQQCQREDGDTFIVADVVRVMKNAGADAETPPDMDDVDKKGYGRELGKAYAREAGRTHGGYRLVQAGTGHNNTKKWRVEVTGGAEGAGPDKTDSENPFGGNGGKGGNDSPLYTREKSSHDASGDMHATRSYTYMGATSVPPVTPVTPNGVPDPREEPLAPAAVDPGTPVHNGAHPGTLTDMPDAITTLFSKVGLPMRPCPKCGTEKVLNDGVWYVCPTCHPATVRPLAAQH